MPVFPTDSDIYCSIYIVNIKLGSSRSFELGVLTWEWGPTLITTFLEQELQVITSLVFN